MGRRLIDADALIEALNLAEWFYVADFNEAVSTVKKAPPVDAVPVVRCRDCMNWIPGYITDTDEMIPPKCGKYQQMVGHSSDDFCSLRERKDGEQ